MRCTCRIGRLGLRLFLRMTGVFITALYTFACSHDLPWRAAHGPSHQEHLHESPWVVTLPLILLAIPRR